MKISPTLSGVLAVDWSHIPAHSLSPNRGLQQWSGSMLRAAVLFAAAASSSGSSLHLDARAHGRSAAPRQVRGLRWAVNEPSAARPWLVDGATGWANTSQSVSAATIGIVVQPVLAIDTSGQLVPYYPDKLHDGSLDAYAAAGLEIILDVGPWVGSAGGFVDRSGGYTGPALEGLNCSSLVMQAEALAKHCVLPDQIIRAALARKEAFAADMLAVLVRYKATGFSTDWETSYGNNQTNAAALWGYVKRALAPHGMKFMPWIQNGGGSNMGPTNFAYCWDYFPLLPIADSLLNMGSYGVVGYSFGPGNPRSVAPVLCTNRSAGVVEPSTAPGGRWCGLGGTVKDILAHGGRASQLSPGLEMSTCANGTHTSLGWSQPTLKAFLEYAGSQGATSVTIWSDGLVSSRKPFNETVRPATSTCPWFVPTLLEWVAAGQS